MNREFPFSMNSNSMQYFRSSLSILILFPPYPRAPNLNIRFFHLAARQRTREENSRRRRRRRSSAASTTQQNENSPNNSGQSAASTAGVLRRALSTELGVGSLGSLFPRRNNPLTASASSSPVINATLVEEPEVVVAERMLLSEKKKMMIIGVVIFVVVIVAVVIILVLFLDTKRDDETAVVPETRRPTMAPTFDNRPTLQIVQERGSVSTLFYYVVIFFADASAFFLK